MSVMSFAINDYFIVRTHKRLTANPALTWVNTYEVWAIGAGDNTDLVSLAQDIASAEKEITYSAVEHVKTTVSTWIEDSHPYDPLAFLEVDTSGAGDLSLGGSELMSLDTVLWLDRTPLSGRRGKIFLRGALTEADVTSPAGSFVLTSGKVSSLNTAITTGAWSFYLASGTNTQFRLAMINPTGSLALTLVSISPRGAIYVPMRHRYYDRAPASPPALVRPLGGSEGAISALASVDTLGPLPGV